MVVKNKILGRFLILLVGIVGLCVRCANPVPLQGGVRDATPPQIDSSHSALSGKTLFKGNKIELVFNEWIQLKEQGQIIVSPPLGTPPSIVVKGKKLLISWEDTLQPNTTYNILFGSAIQDITESNPIPNFTYTFSTGFYIDSLKATGRVLNAQTRQPEKDVLVMLYKELADSVVYAKRPNYFAKTDASGNYELRNLPPGTFKIFALKDNNANYFFDLPDEYIAFTTEPVITSDSLKSLPDLRLSLPSQPLGVATKKTNTYGQIKYTFNQPVPPARPSIIATPVPTVLVPEWVGDTLTLWYHHAPASWQIILGKDTTLINTPDPSTWLKNTKLRIQPKPNNSAKTNTSRSNQTPNTNGDSNNRGGGTIPNEPTPTPSSSNTPMPKATPTHHLKQPYTFWCTQPIQTIDTSKIAVLENNKPIRTPLITPDDDTVRMMRMNQLWRENSQYQIQFERGALIDLFGLQSDTATLFFNTRAAKEYGQITAKVSGLLPAKTYLIELLNAQNVLVAKHNTQLVDTYTFRLAWMEPGEYHFRVTDDVNGNGQWDGSNYKTGTQPESVWEGGNATLRPDWELDMTYEPLNAGGRSGSGRQK
jgi:hypothetical protein